MTQDEFDLITNDAPLCGCGDPDVVWNHLLKALEILNRQTDFMREATPQEWADKWKVYHEEFETLCAKNDVLYWMTLYILDDCGLTEHGGAVSSCWISGKGVDFMEYCKANNEFKHG